MSVKLNQQFCDLESGWMLCRWKVATLGHFAYLQFSYLKDILIKEHALNMLNSQCPWNFLYTIHKCAKRRGSRLPHCSSTDRAPLHFLGVGQSRVPTPHSSQGKCTILQHFCIVRPWWWTPHWSAQNQGVLSSTWWYSLGSYIWFNGSIGIGGIGSSNDFCAMLLFHTNALKHFNVLIYIIYINIYKFLCPPYSCGCIYWIAPRVY